MSDEIIKLLKNKKLQAEVVQTIKEVYNYAGTLYDNPQEDMEDVKGEDLWEEAWWRAETYGKVGRIKQAFEKYVFAKMQKPYRISPKEIIDQFYNMATPGEIGCPELEHIDFDNLYSIFINYIKLHIMSHRFSVPFSICILSEQLCAREDLIKADKFRSPNLQNEDLDLCDQDPDEVRLLWSKNGVNLRLLGKSYYKTMQGSKLYYINAEVSGYMSNISCEQLRKELNYVLESVVRSISLLETPKLIYPALYVDGFPAIQWTESIENHIVFVQKCLDAYYFEPMKKKGKETDSIDRRIRNAVHLLAESDTQSSNAIGLALSVAAIEALLSEKGAEIAEKLSVNVATLLEPDLSKRNNAADFIKEIYNLRSRALHGNLIKQEDQIRLKARHLAAGVLSGIISRRDFLARSGYSPETPTDFLKDLRSTRYAPGQPMGIDESNVSKLWIKRI